jgi:hypothetical protein
VHQQLKICLQASHRQMQTNTHGYLSETLQHEIIPFCFNIYPDDSSGTNKGQMDSC